MLPVLPWPTQSTHGRILNLIRSHQFIARNELAEISELSASTGTDVVRDLIDEGFVRESGAKPTRKVGRDPVSLVLNRDAFFTVGIQIGDSRLVALEIDFQGNVRECIERPT